ncbi:hypothetical protein [Candidatus Sororendozoicomonas aggregata]|uniref:phosphorylase family protein n=1 Tax=Candidatus Sororendozoicomonas aggregata TaxID=3073239 RepID=UPI002ED130D4
MKNITLIVAMEQEALPLIQRLQLLNVSRADARLPFNVYCGGYKTLNVCLMSHGIDRVHKVPCVGTQAATLVTMEAIRCYQPDLIINAGTCGAFAAKGSAVGQVYMGERIRFYDRRIPLGDYKTYGEGHYPCPEGVTLARAINLPLAVVCTGNSLDMSPTDEAILRQEPVVAKEMEAGAVAWVASLYSVPVVAIKAVTDLVDHPVAAPEQFSHNLQRAAENLCHPVIALLDELSRR